MADPGRGHGKVYDESHVCSPGGDGQLCREGGHPSPTTTITPCMHRPPRMACNTRPHTALRADSQAVSDKDIAINTPRATKTHLQKDTRPWRKALHGYKQPQKQTETQRQRYSYEDHPHSYKTCTPTHRTLTCSHTLPQAPLQSESQRRWHRSHTPSPYESQKHTETWIPIHTYVHTHTHPAAETQKQNTHCMYTYKEKVSSRHPLASQVMVPLATLATVRCP